MIEVLVAATIMIMLMLMLGMLFQQTSQAWRTGRQRADALLKARALFGILQRDVSAAVDIKTLPEDFQKAIETLDGSLQQSFGSGEISFFTLTGTGYNRGKSAKDSEPPLRSLTHVTYNQSGRREEVTITPTSSGGLRKGETLSTALLSSNLGGQSLTISDFSFHYLDRSGGGGGTRFPSYIMINADAQASTSTVEIGAGSAGPDRTWETRDDIVTWTERK